MAKAFKKTGWYSVSEDTLRGLAKLVLGVGLLIGGYQAYQRWDEYTLERRANETLDRARVLMRTLSSDSNTTGYQDELSKASLHLSEAEDAWKGGSYRSALGKAQISRGLLLDVLDSMQNPGRRGEARFIYIEGVVEYRRGETGSFRRARPRDALYDGDYVRSSGQGSAELLFDSDGTLFTVRPGTMLKVQRQLGLSSRKQPVRMEYGWVDLQTSGRPSGVETEYAALQLNTESEATITFEEHSSTGRFAVGRGSGAVEAAESGDVLRLGALKQVVQKESELGAATDLLERPDIVSPPSNFDLNLDRTREVALSWDRVDGSAGYRFQVSRNRLFGDPLVDTKRAKTNATLGVNGQGNFYWRVAAYAPDGSLGPWSAMRKFRVLSFGGIGWKDTVAPALDIAGVNVNGNIVIVTGRTEPGVRLEIDGQRAPVAADGEFTLSVTPDSEGLVNLVVSAVDASGNRTLKTRQVFIETL